MFSMPDQNAQRIGTRVCPLILQADHRVSGGRPPDPSAACFESLARRIDGMPSFGGPPERISAQAIRDLLKSVLLQPSQLRETAGSALAAASHRSAGSPRNSNSDASSRASSPAACRAASNWGARIQALRPGHMADADSFAAAPTKVTAPVVTIFLIDRSKTACELHAGSGQSPVGRTKARGTSPRSFDEDKALDAAIACFGEWGAGSVTVRVLAEHMGIHKK